MQESVQSCFELSIHFSVFFSRELFLEAVHGWFGIEKCMENSKRDWTLSGTATSFQFFLKKIFFIVPKVSNS